MLRFLRGSSVLLLAAVALTATGAAWASPPVIDQYFEEVPTATGGAGSGSGQGGSGGGSSGGGSSGGGGLAAAVLDQLESTVSPAVASELQEVATSTRLGAPSITLKQPSDEASLGSATSDGAASSALTVAADGSEAHLTILVILVGLITGAAIVAASRRRRQTPA